MLRMREKYVIDARGRKTAVVLNMREYRRLMGRLEDLEDALELDEAKRTSTGSKSYDELRGDLKQAGRL